MKSAELKALCGCLQGMFAFAIWGEKDHTLFVARDCVGTKPLYYVDTGKGLVFRA